MAEIRRGPFIVVFGLGHQLGALLNQCMAGCPLSPEDFAVTSALRLIEPARPSDLADFLGMRPTTLSNYLRRLGDRGLVRRRRHPSDGRAALVSLTAKGRGETEACFPGFREAIDAFREQLTAAGHDAGAVLAALEATGSALDGALAETRRDAAANG